MYEPIRGGTRGGAAEFKWTDVSADKDREHYLGHSINAPTGRWQKNKDVHWYNRDKEMSEAQRMEEIRRVKEAEEEALSVALGFKPTVRANPDAPVPDNENTEAGDMQPAEDIQKVLAIEHLKREKAERKAEKERKRVEKEQRRAARDERRRDRKERHDSSRRHDRSDELRRHYEDRHRGYENHRRDRDHSYSRSRSPLSREHAHQRGARRYSESMSRSRSPPRRIDRYERPHRRSITPPSHHRDGPYTDTTRRRYSPDRRENNYPAPRRDSLSPRRSRPSLAHRSRSPMREDIPGRHGDYRRGPRSPPPKRNYPVSPPMRRRYVSPDRRSRSRSPHPIVVP